MRIWSVIAEMVGSYGRSALVTVAEVRGSAPREPGARMVVAPDGGFRGTIGGGELEWRALGVARDMLSRDVPAATLGRLVLGPDLGQCCGGRVRLLTEVFDRDRLDEVRALAAREAAGPFTTRGRIGPERVERTIDGGAGKGDARTGAPGPAAEIGAAPLDEPPLRGDVARAGTSVALEAEGIIVERFSDPRRPVWLFGAGHVGRALILALAPLPFDVTWIDEREDAFPAVVPANVRPMRSPDPASELARAPSNAMVVVMTHRHPLDLAVVHAALAAERFGYVGLIGSASKRARFTRQLREAGVAEARIAELVCPVGIAAIRSKHPAAIAAGLAVQLLERDEALAESAEPVRGVAAGASR